MTAISDDAYADSVYARLFHIDDEGEAPRIYPHARMAVGAAVDVPALVVIHVTLGKARFEFQITPDNAREFAKSMLQSADWADEAETI